MGCFGAAPRSGPPLAGGGTVEIAGLVLGRQSIAIVLAAVAIAVALHLLLMRTRIGWRMRAAAEDPEMARALGVPVGAMTALAFALSAALAGTAGLLLANQYFVTPEDGGPLMLKAYIAATLGGWGRLDGAVAGALVIAFFEVGVAALLPPRRRGDARGGGDRDPVAPAPRAVRRACRPTRLSGRPPAI